VWKKLLSFDQFCLKKIFLNGKTSASNMCIGLQIRTSANSILEMQVIKNRHKTKLKNFNLQRLLLATTISNPDINSLDAKKLPKSRYKEVWILKCQLGNLSNNLFTIRKSFMPACFHFVDIRIFSTNSITVLGIKFKFVKIIK